MKDQPEKFTLWHGVLLGEFFALLVALATTIIPTKTGSKYGIAGHFFEEPTFLQEFTVNLIGVHLVLVLLALVVVVWSRLSGSGESEP